MRDMRFGMIYSAAVGYDGNFFGRADAIYYFRDVVGVGGLFRYQKGTNDDDRASYDFRSIVLAPVAQVRGISDRCGVFSFWMLPPAYRSGARSTPMIRVIMRGNLPIRSRR